MSTPKHTYDSNQHETEKRQLWAQIFYQVLNNGKDVSQATAAAHEAVASYDIEFNPKKK